MDTTEMVGVVSSKVQPAPPQRVSSAVSVGTGDHNAIFMETPEVQDNMCEHGIPLNPSALEERDDVTCLLCRRLEPSSSKDSVGQVTDSRPKLHRTSSAEGAESGMRRPRLRRDGVVSLQTQPKILAESPRPLSKVASDPVLADLYRSDSLGSFADDINLHRRCHDNNKERRSQEPRGCQLRRVHSLKSIFCLPEYDVNAQGAHGYREARQCTRVTSRRNALDNPFEMTMPQTTRERIQKEVAERKSSVKRKISQYFKVLLEDEPEIDLV